MKRLASRWTAVLLAGIVVAAACDDDSNTPSDQGSLTLQAGNGQTATVATTVQPFEVLLQDQAGAAKAGVTVEWQVTSGGGSVAPASATTDANGVATTTATLGTPAGEQTFRARAPGYTGSPLTFSVTATAAAAAAIVKSAGDAQSAPRASLLRQPLTVTAQDQYDNPVAGVSVTWTVAPAGGSVDQASTVTGANGTTSVNWTLGMTTGTVSVVAAITGVDSVTFTATARATFLVRGGGNNVPERFGSDLWLADGYAYTGSWGFRGTAGNAVKIWQLDAGGAPILHDSIITSNIGTVSDIEVSPDGKWLVFTAEGGPGSGLYVYELTSPGTPVFRASTPVSGGLHTGALSVIGGTLYAFTAKDPSSCALRIYNLSAAASGTITLSSATPIPDNYCIHDTFVRDGYAFVFAWDEGLYIFDAGNGSHGGTPTAPVQISHTGGFGGQSHNGWWFWNPNGQKKYLFIGEEGPASIGTFSSGDIHVVDVSDLANPQEVGFYRVPGAGAHNFWMDEQAQVLYAAFYNGGVAAIDVSGTLSGNLASREIARIEPGGNGNTFVWGVMLYGGYLYASDMLSGFWQLETP